MREAAPLRVLVAGAAGPLGGGLLRDAWTCEAAHQITVLTRQPLRPVSPRLRSGWATDEAEASVWLSRLPDQDMAVLHTGRPRSEREAVFWSPRRSQLPALAQALRVRGVRALLVVLAPGDPAFSPQERAALESLAFEHLALRDPPADTLRAQPAACLAQRCADWMIRTLVRFMAAPAPVRRRRSARSPTNRSSGPRA
ncbi:hypothetical protein [Hydrogenophaga sp.]|uniref:hypothetical protein n=1 Tax=Hydrogenophaga sp. TaxID=1904254 RepID=UPI002638BB91|nr:hypothetical protein [Hydrogenophaga sp.]MCW5654232.1 hypothetical protein [Hydrogenophaga sp.]